MNNLLRRFKIPEYNRFLCGLTDRLCWKCGITIEDVASLACTQCQAVQIVDQRLSYYQLFGITQKFTLDINELTERFRRVQSFVHPDKFSRSSELEQEYSSACSSFVNSAYKTLIDPIERGNYLLKLENQQPVEDSMVDVNQEFLLEVMELNETLASNPNSSELEKINNDNKEKIVCLTNELAEAFNEKHWENVKTILAKLKYYTNIDGKIKELKLKS